MMRRFSDPRTPNVVAHRRPDGMPPKEVVDQFLRDAREQGCTCKPVVEIRRNPNQISLGHKGHCPLLRVLQEGQL